MVRPGPAWLVLVAAALLAVAACGRGAAPPAPQSAPTLEPLAALPRPTETAIPTPPPDAPLPPSIAQPVRPGLEVLLDERLDLVRGKRLALLTNQSGVDRQGRSGIELLRAQPEIELVALFTPEHGLRGQAEAGQAVGDGREARTDLPVYSLYGEAHRPTAAQLQDVDLLVVDLQDLGLRFYTYVATLAEVLQTGAEYGVPVLVLDRPAPLGGQVVEGNVLDPRFTSFVGPFPLPARYGLTIGELARLLNERFGLGAELAVVPLQGWQRRMWHDQTGLPWVPPSPNLPTLEAATVYPGTVLFEGTNLSEGRGTARPFQWIGAPWVDGRRWAEALNALDLPGVRFEAVVFTPTTSRYAGQRCSGVALQVVDRDHFQSIAVALQMLATARHLHLQAFAFRAEHFDLLAGTDATRRALERGTPVAQVVATWQVQQAEFEPLRQRYQLYP